jgi:hypothetical protein
MTSVSPLKEGNNMAKKLVSNELEITGHATQRMAQRRFNKENIEFVICYGEVLYRTGAIFYFLTEANIPANERKDEKKLGMVGMTVLCSSDGQTIITVYKNQKGLRKIKKKEKRRIHCHGHFAKYDYNNAA